jgi:hypothetical protein
LGVVALAAIMRAINHWLQWPILAGVAEAFAVAGIVGMILELFAIRFLIERVASDVADRLAGRNLPLELRRLIGSILETHIVREGYVKTYKLSAPDADGFLRVDITIRFAVKNYSNVDTEYSPMIQEEIFYSPEFKHVEYGLHPNISHVLTEDQIRGRESIDPATQVKTLKGDAITIPSIHGEKGAAVCNVLMRYSLRMREEYSDVTSFGGATLGATIEADEVPPSLEFTSSGDETMQHTPNSKIWVFTRPYINGQHIRVWWFKKPA